MQNNGKKNGTDCRYYFLAKLLVLAVVMLLPITALAAGGSSAHHGHQVTFTEILIKLVPYWVNLLIFITVIVLAARKPLKNYWEQRRTDISRTIETGRLELQEITKLWERMKERVASIGDEQSRLAGEIASDTEVEIAQILRDADERVKLINQQAAISIQSERKAAEDRVQSDLINSVIALAAEKLKQQLDVDTDRHIRGATLQQVKGLN